MNVQISHDNLRHLNVHFQIHWKIFSVGFGWKIGSIDSTEFLFKSLIHTQYARQLSNEDAIPVAITTILITRYNFLKHAKLYQNQF